MLETFLMAFSVVVLGYAFYVSSRLFWAFKKDKGRWRLMYGLLSVFTICTYFILAIILLSFITVSAVSPFVISAMDIIISVFFLSSSCLIAAVMKYHVSMVRLSEEKSKKTSGKTVKKAKQKGRKTDKEKAALEKEIMNLRWQLDEAEALNRLAVGRELKIIELNKKLEQLEKKK